MLSKFRRGKAWCIGPLMRTGAAFQDPGVPELELQKNSLSCCKKIVGFSESTKTAIKWRNRGAEHFNNGLIKRLYHSRQGRRCDSCGEIDALFTFANACDSACMKKDRAHVIFLCYLLRRSFPALCSMI